MAKPGHDRRRRRVLRQELDHLRHVAAEPALRQLLHGVGRPRQRATDLHEHVDGRRPDVGPADAPAGLATGLGGQPVAQPNGTVDRAVRASGTEHPRVQLDRRRRHVDRPSRSSNVTDHGVAGESAHVGRCPRPRSTPQGKVYVVWQDCRFRSGCTSNDIVMSHVHGRDDVDGSGAHPDRRDDAAAPTTSSPASPSTARPRATPPGSALAYYYYPVAACTASTCDLTVGFVSSTDGGATWTQPRKVAGPFKLAWLAQTDQGPMVGDYISTSFAGGPLAFGVFAIAKPPLNGVFDERAASARFDVTIPQAGVPDPGATRPDPVPSARVGEGPARARH